MSAAATRRRARFYFNARRVDNPRGSSLWLGLWCLAALLAAPTALLRGQDAPPRAPWTELRFAPAAGRVRLAREVTLLEGLPHQLVEHGSFLRELQTRANVEFAGYAFYKRPLPLADADREALREIFTDARTFRAYSGPKKCGGFHPDYAVAWGRGGATERLLVCFGCHEILVANADQQLIADLPGPAYERLRAILSKYHAQRPPFARGG